MKKSKKLLSVLLAVLMILSSMSVMASAARTNYKTSADLEALDAYSPYGQVTRLSTEERLSIFCDYLDTILDNPSLNMGTLIDTMGITLTVNLTSVNNICETLDNVKSVKSNGLVKAIAWMLGIVADLNINSWQYDVDRDQGGANSHSLVVTNLLKVVNDNASLITNILRTGKVDLGVANSAVAGLDLSMIADIPGLLKGFIVPLFYRWDDSIELMNEYNNAIKGDGKFEAVLSGFVQRLFTNNMSIASYAVNAAGECVSAMTLPTEDGKRTKFAINGDTITRYSYDLKTGAYCAEEDATVYTKTERKDAAGNGIGEFVFADENGNELQWYVNNSPALHCFLNEDGTTKFEINILTDSALGLLFKFVPYVVEDLAVVPANGSLKKEMAWLFGAQWGSAMTEEQVAAAKADPATAEFFNKPEGVYAFGYSDYAVINGDHYWRYKNDFYKADLTNINPFFNIINWNYHFNGDFMNKYLPGAEGNAYTSVLQSLNNFLIDVAEQVLVPDLFNAMNLVRGDNTNLVENLKRGARAVIETSAASIFGENYQEHYPYYDMMMNSTDDQEVLCGIAMTLIQVLMPQFIVPAPEKMQGQKVGAVLAMLIRELATQLVPNHNFDALIYDGDYINKTLIAGKDNSYWLDVILTIGTDIGVFYLKNLADMGEDQPAWSAMAYVDSPKAYTVEDLNLDAEVNLWEQRVDYIIDWALGSEEFSWKVGKLVNYGSETVDLATVQNPWIKLGNILKNHLPIEDVLNVSTVEANWLETTLRDNFVMALLDLHVEKIIGGANADGILNLPQNSILRQDGLLSNIVVVVRNLLNGLVSKIGGNFTLIPTNITTLDAVLNQTNICNVVETLLGRLDDADANGLFDLAMPFLNMFAGWKTNAQYFAKPEIKLSNPSNATYAYTGETQTIQVVNNSSGMLEKHGADYDKSYDIVIDNVTATKGSVAFTEGQAIVPGASASFTYTPGSDEGAARIDVKYHVVFKDGNVVGGPQTAYFFTYVTNTNTDLPAGGTAQTQGNGGDAWAYTKAYWNADRYTNNPAAIPSILNNIYINVENTSVFGNGGRNYSYSGFDNTYVSAKPGVSYGGQDSKSTVALYPAVGKDATAYENIPSGTIFALGTVKFQGRYITWKNTYSINLGNFYYANTMALESLFHSVADNGYQRQYFSADADAEWNELFAAMDNAAPYVNAPKLKATFAETYTQANIDAAYNRLDAAVKALGKKASTSATSDVLKDALKETDPSWIDATSEVPGVNYQDYRLYEYWAYEHQRNDVWNRIAEYDAAAKVGKSLAYTALDNADLAQKLKYYRQFLVANTTNYQFLEKEIAYANAQNYVETEYTAVSWAAYTNALAKANEIMANHAAGTETLQSQVFDAKYALMLAQNQLAPATNDPVLVPENPDGQESGGVIATADGFVYGIEVGANVEDFFQVKDGKMAVVKNAAGYTNGTGAKVQVYTNDDKLVAEYTLVVFGDVDGDGVLSTADAIKVEQYAGGDHAKIEIEAALLAADVDNDTALSSADAIKIEQYAGGDHAKVPQTR